MRKKDKRIDAYIEKSQDFVKPVLKHTRSLVHKACPDVEETVKWGFPHFYYKGMMCNIASFKNHCTFGFWKGSLIKDLDKVSKKSGERAMGQFGRITTISDLPSQKIMLGFIKEAVRLNDEGIKLPSKQKSEKEKKINIPAYFLEALRKNKKALKIFESFGNSHKKEYVEWITEAKTEATRLKRLKTAVEWMAEGKARNWKYIRK